MVSKIDLKNDNSCARADKYWNGNNKHNICAVNINNRGFCFGDSGGPLVFDSRNPLKQNIKNAIVGVVSFVLPVDDTGVEVCEKKDTLYFFTNAYYYIDWISKHSGISRKKLVYYSEK
ncbi:hypothetical protein AYI70_g12408 [Smittium culicis]|uniref:Peptidase S1 domain-containing protein n=1 Tax=Smittium culicis TaxID=133412 RepID=A0A1R1WXM6_9FUNG|nr:hypothetical protein AYI70_g12408 [Smittium culicis]